MIRFLAKITTLASEESQEKSASILRKVVNLLTQTSSKKKIDHFLQFNLFIQLLFENTQKNHFEILLLIIQHLKTIKEVNPLFDNL